MNLAFRRIESSEAKLLRTVADDVFDNPFDLERAERFLSDPRNILIVAIEDGRIIGQIAAVVHQHVDAPADLYIDNLGVTPSQQRRGIARRLIALALEAGQQQEAESAWVAVDADNTVAQKLYDKTGAASAPVLMFTYAARLAMSRMGSAQT
jgi:ribosomal protein S18 acetylase RimI-like enzyme